MTKEEILRELAKTRIELGLLQLEQAPRKFRFPKDTGMVADGTSGRCVVCDKEYDSNETVRRCARIELVLIKGELTEVVHGFRVCWRCCPYTHDWQLDRYDINIDFWDKRWLKYEDNAQYKNSKSVPDSGSRLAELLLINTPEELYKMAGKKACYSYKGWLQLGWHSEADFDVEYKKVYPKPWKTGALIRARCLFWYKVGQRCHNQGINPC